MDSWLIPPMGNPPATSSMSTAAMMLSALISPIFEFLRDKAGLMQSGLCFIIISLISLNPQPVAV
jgi:hypothetical protein